MMPHSRLAAGCRYRVHQYIPYLEAHGVSCDFSELVDERLYSIFYRSGQKARKSLLFLGRTLVRLRDLTRARRYDLIFIHRECFPMGPPLAEQYLRGLGVPIVYDFDDAIYMPRANWLKSLVRCPEKTNTIVHLADRVIVSNEHLRAYCSAFTKRVHVIPTTIDTERFRPANGERSPRERIRIGWIGSHSTAKYLDEIKGALARVAAQIPIEILVVGASRNFEVPGAEVINVDWSLEREVSDFQSIDIGVYPLADSEWELGKAGFKTIQYMAVGVPSVVAPVGVNASIVQHGVTGYFAATEDEWVEHLLRLGRSREERERIGAAGRAWVVDNFSTERHAPALLEILRDASGV